eukprot:g838.t1
MTLHGNEVLLLRNVLKISSDSRYISFAELVQMVSNWLFEANSKESGEDSTRAANLRESLNSSLEVLPKLNVGLDVNCRFGGVADFEYTQETTVFDMLDIALFHAWIVPKEEFSSITMQEFASEKVARHGTDAIHLLFGKGKSYQNQHSSGKGKSTYRAYVSYPDVDERSSSAWETMEETFETNFDEGNSHASLGDGFDEEEEQEQEFHYLEDEEEAITLNTILDLEEADDRQAGTDPENEKLIEEGLLIKEFLDSLLALHEAVRERQLAVFFRNSHFNTILKYDGNLYLLCTDIAFANSHLLWERFTEVDGDTDYCDEDFRSGQEAAHVHVPEVQPQGQGSMEDADAQLAWQMMQEDETISLLIVGLVEIWEELQAQEQEAFVQAQQVAWQEAQAAQAVQAASKAKAKPKPKAKPAWTPELAMCGAD